MASSRFERMLEWRCALPDPAVELDMSFSGLDEAVIEGLQERMAGALQAMDAIERGEVANPDEHRMVGHYWLRAPGLAPTEEISEAIADALAEVEGFAARIHAEGAFDRALLIGIGGSALGPMLLADVFGGTRARMQVDVLDNTDPDGVDSMLERIGSLQRTIVVVVSKSGGTPETRNGMLEVQAACAAQGLEFAQRAVAVTGDDSELHRRAASEGWLATFPMWDWVGGRTSVLSAVGLLPAALLGADIRGLLTGAAEMDSCTRETGVRRNPAALLAALMYAEGQGSGGRHMVVLPYKDRLVLLGRYLQQLVMESLGKRLDRQGRVVHQGLSVFGNKGSTDQHAYVQQLRDGRHDFFAVFIRVLQDRDGPSVEVAPGVTAGDFLDGFLLGTRQALADEGRHSATITVDRLDERVLGALIALFERAVGLYGELIDVNAYHQPGVEAGKKAAARVLDMQAALLAALDGAPKTVVEIARLAALDPADAWPVLQHLAANREGVRMSGGPDAGEARFAAQP